MAKTNSRYSTRRVYNTKNGRRGQFYNPRSPAPKQW